MTPASFESLASVKAEQAKTAWRLWRDRVERRTILTYVDTYRALQAVRQAEDYLDAADCHLMAITSRLEVLRGEAA